MLNAGQAAVLVHGDGDQVDRIRGSPTPGTCHVTFTFATGFTYSADVTFASMNDSEPGCAPCPSYIGPVSNSGPKVNNPPETCVALDSGAEDDVSDAQVSDTGAD
jgi:hypothetical protein